MPRKKKLERTIISLALLGMCACAASSAGTYGPALSGAGALLVTTAIHRSITGDCWANCGRGHVCDRNSGLCVEGECTPGCAPYESCQKLSVGFACVPTDLGTRTRAAKPESPSPRSQGARAAFAGAGPVPL